jgi:hypothetical protein
MLARFRWATLCHRKPCSACGSGAPGGKCRRGRPRPCGIN